MKPTIHIKSKFSCLLLLLTSYSLFIACQSKPNPIESHNTAQYPTTEPTTTQESIPPTMTTMPTATPILATTTPTPQPTLTRAEKEAIVTELYKTNAGCELPCWWGIIPGETDWNTAKLLLERVAIEINTSAESKSDQLYSVDVDIPVPAEISQYDFLRQYFIVHNGIVTNIRPELPDRMLWINISQILSMYGDPSEIWIDTYGTSYGEIDPFRLVLFYPEKGFLVRYFDDADFINNYVVGCFGGYFGAIHIWAPELGLTFNEALNVNYSPQYYKPLEEVTELDIETFYQAHLDPNTEICIETPIELWQDR